VQVEIKEVFWAGKKENVTCPPRLRERRLTMAGVKRETSEF